MKTIRLRVLLWSLMLLPSVGMAEPVSLPELMGLFAQHEQRSVSYIEHQYLDILDMPLKSSGTLTYRAPDYLEKKVDNGGGSYRVQGQQLQVEQNGKPRSIALESYPALAAFVAAFRATLAGDTRTLQRYYQTDLQGEWDDWSLTLKPTQAEMSRVVREIRLHGKAGRINLIETLEQGGDHSRMQLGTGDEN
ncbi:MAG: LolA-related protein [Pseudomonadota bacterium]